mmetsp:Transcript_15664/g.46215  ORF Transcript_15664/g.46215 Transcript_15664/m.46215 type:complete len:223 (+) Transcript_15664:2172-2840(+)|eukprot:364861-Chlamydomonas_euryale.AAC.10
MRSASAAAAEQVLGHSKRKRNLRAVGQEGRGCTRRAAPLLSIQAAALLRQAMLRDREGASAGMGGPLVFRRVSTWAADRLGPAHAQQRKVALGAAVRTAAGLEEVVVVQRELQVAGRLGLDGEQHAVRGSCMLAMLGRSSRHEVGAAHAAAVDAVVDSGQLQQHQLREQIWAAGLRRCLLQPHLVVIAVDQRYKAGSAGRAAPAPARGALLHRRLVARRLGA